MHVENLPLRINLYSDLPERKAMLIASFNQAKSPCDIRRLPPSGRIRDLNAAPPDLVLLDFENVETNTLHSLQHFEQRRSNATAPVLLITNPRTQDLLEKDKVDVIEPLSFSPFSLPALAFHTRRATREHFLIRLRRLYEYGTISVRLPQAVLFHENRRRRVTA